MDPVRIGLKLSQQNTNPAELRAIWQVADQSGFDHLWNFDHFAAIMSDPELDVLEGWTLLGAMAEATSRVRIGCMVTGNTYRHPAVLAKMAVTVDHLSGGRLELGIGAAWAEIEHEMLGIEFGTAGRRVEWLDEACQVDEAAVHARSAATFEGARYTLRDAIANPKPVQRPHPPFWIGGRGERKTLRVIAQHADVWNAPGGEPDEVARLAGVLDAPLRRHRPRPRRDPALGAGPLRRRRRCAAAQRRRVRRAQRARPDRDRLARPGACARRGRRCALAAPARARLRRVSEVRLAAPRDACPPNTAGRRARPRIGRTPVPDSVPLEVAVFPILSSSLLFVLLPIASIWFGVDSRDRAPASAPVVAAVRLTRRRAPRLASWPPQLDHRGISSALERWMRIEPLDRCAVERSSAQLSRSTHDSAVAPTPAASRRYGWPHRRTQASRTSWHGRRGAS